MKTFEATVQSIEERLFDRWVPEQWRESRAMFTGAGVQLRATVLEAIARPSFRRWQEPRVLTPQEQGQLAAFIAASKPFADDVPRIIAMLKHDLLLAQIDAAKTIYRQVVQAWADAYTAHTPGFVQFSAIVDKDELSALRKLRYEGLTYSEALDAIFEPMAKQLRAVVNANISSHGTAGVAQRAILDRLAGMLNSTQTAVERTFTQFATYVYKQAEQSTKNIQRVD